MEWQTASETNNKGFNIERTLNPKDGFKTIGWLDGKGNSEILNDYSFIDHSIEMGKVYYYRLQQVDFDLVSDFSSTIVIRTALPGENWTIFPNPAMDIISISSKQGIQELEGFVQIIDVNGRVVFSERVLVQKEEGVELSIDYLSPGIYSFLIRSDEGQVLTTERLIRK